MVNFLIFNLLSLSLIFFSIAPLQIKSELISAQMFLLLRKRDSRARNLWATDDKAGPASKSQISRRPRERCCLDMKIQRFTFELFPNTIISGKMKPSSCRRRNLLYYKLLLLKSRRGHRSEFLKACIVERRFLDTAIDPHMKRIHEMLKILKSNPF